MTPEQRQRNIMRCAEIVRQLNDPDWPDLDDQGRADLQAELDDLRYERDRQERLWRTA